MFPYPPYIAQCCRRCHFAFQRPLLVLVFEKFCALKGTTFAPVDGSSCACLHCSEELWFMSIIGQGLLWIRNRSFAGPGVVVRYGPGRCLRLRVSVSSLCTLHSVFWLSNPLFNDSFFLWERCCESTKHILFSFPTLMGRHLCISGLQWGSSILW